MTTKNKNGYSYTPVNMYGKQKTRSIFFFFFIFVWLLIIWIHILCTMKKQQQQQKKYSKKTTTRRFFNHLSSRFRHSFTQKINDHLISPLCCIVCVCVCVCVLSLLLRSSSFWWWWWWWSEKKKKGCLLLLWIVIGKTKTEQNRKMLFIDSGKTAKRKKTKTKIVIYHRIAYFTHNTEYLYYRCTHTAWYFALLDAKY